MQVFGLTSVDTALSVAGLNMSQLLMETIFKKGGIGVVVGVIAYLLMIWRLTQSGQFTRIGFYSVLLIVLILLLLPSQTLTDYTSSQASQDNSSHKTTNLKDSLTGFDRVPTIFTFVSNGMDKVSYGLINALDKAMPTGAKFLPQAYQIPIQALYIKEAAAVGFTDPKLRDRFELFVIKHYLPALTRYKHEHVDAPVNLLGPTDEKIKEYYSEDEKKQLSGADGIEALSFNYFESNDHLKQQARSCFLPLMSSADDHVLKDAILSTFAQQAVLYRGQKGQIEPYRSFFLLIRSFPYIHGAAQIVLAIIFPFILLALLLSGRPAIFIHYFLNFIWVKSWIICIAISLYISIFIAHIQLVQGQGIGSLWEFPYFADAFVLLVLVFVFLTRVIIIKGGGR